MAQETMDTTAAESSYPVQYSVEYPESSNRLTALFRPILIIPMAVIYILVYGTLGSTLFPAVLLMLLFRQKYPRWWFDLNLEVQRFSARFWAYLSLLRDEYPSTDEAQAVQLDIEYPDAQNDLNRWLPLIKWLLAIPHWNHHLGTFVRLRDRRGDFVDRDHHHREAPARASSTSSSATAGGQPGQTHTHSCSQPTGTRPSASARKRRLQRNIFVRRNSIRCLVNERY